MIYLFVKFKYGFYRESKVLLFILFKNYHAIYPMNLKEKLLLTVPEFDFREYQNEDDFIVVCFFALFTANNMHSTTIMEHCANCIAFIYNNKYPDYDAMLDQIALTLFDEDQFNEAFLDLLPAEVQQRFHNSIAMWRQGSGSVQ